MTDKTAPRLLKAPVTLGSFGSGTVVDDPTKATSSKVASFTKDAASRAPAPLTSESKADRRRRKRRQAKERKEASKGNAMCNEGTGDNESGVEQLHAETGKAKSGVAVSGPTSDDSLANLLVSSEESRFAMDHIGDSREVHIRRIDVSFLDGPTILEGASLVLSPPHVYGLIGHNGTGKSTIMKALARGKLQAFPEHITTLYIDQGASIVFDSVLAYVVAGNAELIRLRKRQAQLLADIDRENSAAPEVYDDDTGKRNDDSAEAATMKGACKQEHVMELTETLTAVTEQLALAGDESAEEEARAALEKLAFTEDMMNANAASLSGGWRMKAALARCMYHPPQFLLLDEPNNFLDLHGVLWLQRFIRTLEDTCVVVVSHDRAFLDAITTDILELREKKLHHFHGNFSHFMRDKEEKFQKKLRLYENQERNRARYQKTIEQGIQTARRTGNDKILGMVASRKKKLTDRIGAEKREDGKRWRTNTRRDTSSQKRYESAIDGTRQEIEKPVPPKKLKFKFPTTLPLLPTARCIALDNVSFSYTPTKPVLENIDFSLDLGEKVGILGRNGAGKSTLINLIMKKISPAKGTVDVSRHAKIALFNQFHEDALDMRMSALEHLKDKFPEKKEQELRNHLGSYGIGGDKAANPMSSLSGGQKTRVSLATIAMSDPHILIADEISNHLDFDSIEALIEALQGFPGAVLVVSHDRHFMGSVVNEYFELKDRHLKRLPTSFSEYTEKIIASDKLCTI